MKIKLIECGHCTGRESMVLQGGSRKVLNIPALVGLLQHPVHGNILFDTGYSERFYEATAKWPAKLTSILLPTYVKPEESAKNRLAALGIAAEDVRYIIVSHFHVDHICGLKDFPNARYVCSQAALDNALKAKGFSAISKGVLPTLLPADLQQRSWAFDSDGSVSKATHEILGDIYDLFGDSTVKLVQLPGHHNGQIGAILKDEKDREIFLCADACWLSESYRENRLPSWLTKLLITDWKAYKNTIDMLHRYYKKYPEMPIIPTHCRKAQDELKSRHSDFFI
jgi:glyoxylase-like metal-dependent hydrolase (beta-lactamase superfamily II)